MNELLDHDAKPTRGERELTLSTGAILGIFLGLVLLCGACFGVGYNVGRKSTPVPLALNDAGSDTLAPSDAGAGAKPAPGVPAESTGASQPAAPVVAHAAAAPKPAPVVRRPPPTEDDADTPAANASETTHESPGSTTPGVKAVSPAALMPSTRPVPGQTGSIMVQVAAVSHREDADLLLGALRARGYTVSARPSATDNFIHVQVGPFSNKKDAEAMRQRLLADGYNALLKN